MRCRAVSVEGNDGESFWILTETGRNYLFIPVEILGL